MNNYTGKIILLIGGTEEGETSFVQDLLDSGATVIIPAQSKRKAELLRRRIKLSPNSELITLVVQPDELNSALKLYHHLRRRFGRVDTVLALPHHEALVAALVCDEKKEMVQFCNDKQAGQ
jgi:short-subunit dehydrogenase involved in D-alanine esterification of teichoic acids